MRTTVAVAVALLSVIAVRPVRAQRLDPGSKVRFTARGSDGEHGGTLVALTPDSLIVHARADTARWARAAITRLQVGTPGSHVAGMTIGAVAGFAAGVFIGTSLNDREPTGSFGDIGHDLGEDISRAVILGLAGGAIGGYFGYRLTGTRWRDVPLEIGLRGRGVGVRVGL